MKIYLASTAPGSEERLNIEKRLLSYHLIVTKTLQCDKIFDNIKRNNGKSIRRRK